MSGERTLLPLTTSKLSPLLPPAYAMPASARLRTSTRPSTSARRTRVGLLTCPPWTLLLTWGRRGYRSNSEAPVLLKQLAVDFDAAARAQIADHVGVDGALVGAAGLRVAGADGQV